MAAPMIYIAGPCTGLLHSNYPAFNAEADRLRAIGYRVKNPAELPVQGSWQAYMRQALAQLVKCDAVALMPGWKRSRGARIKNDLAVSLGIPSRPVDQFQLPAQDPDCWLCEGTGSIDKTPCPECRRLPL